MAKRIKFESFYDFIKRDIPHPPPIIGNGILVPNSKFVLYSESGVGKSHLALHTAACIATGKPWFGYPTIKSDVFYIQFEQTEAELHLRALDYIKWMEQVDSPAIFNVATEPELALDIPDGRASLTTSIDVLRLNTGRHKVLILDPLYKTMRYDLTNNLAVANWVREIEAIMAQYNCAVIIIAHTRKPSEEDREQVSNFSRLFGSSILYNNVDTAAYASTSGKGSSGELQPGVIRFNKHRHAVEAIRPIRYAWNGNYPYLVRQVGKEDILNVHIKS